MAEIIAFPSELQRDTQRVMTAYERDLYPELVTSWDELQAAVREYAGIPDRVRGTTYGWPKLDGRARGQGRDEITATSLELTGCLYANRTDEAALAVAALTSMSFLERMPDSKVAECYGRLEGHTSGYLIEVIYADDDTPERFSFDRPATLSPLAVGGELHESDIQTVLMRYEKRTRRLRDQVADTIGLLSVSSSVPEEDASSCPVLTLR